MSEPDKSQLDKFKELAREVGADASEPRFKKSLKKVAKAPKPPAKPGK